MYHSFSMYAADMCMSESEEKEAIQRHHWK